MYRVLSIYFIVNFRRYSTQELFFLFWQIAQGNVLHIFISKRYTELTELLLPILIIINSPTPPPPTGQKE